MRDLEAENISRAMLHIASEIVNNANAETDDNTLTELADEAISFLPRELMVALAKYLIDILEGI